MVKVRVAAKERLACNGDICHVVSGDKWDTAVSTLITNSSVITTAEVRHQAQTAPAYRPWENFHHLGALR
jgi:hypothetical protein